MLPLVVPSIILAIALLIVLRKVFDIPLSLWTVGAGHVLICVPFSMLVLMSRLEGFDKSLEEASDDLGENGWMTFWRVTFPLALPGIVSSLLLSFTVSFDEFVIAFFLSGTDQTLPIYIWSQLRFPDKLPMTAGAGTLHPLRLHHHRRRFRAAAPARRQIHPPHGTLKRHERQRHASSPCRTSPSISAP